MSPARRPLIGILILAGFVLLAARSHLALTLLGALLVHLALLASVQGQPASSPWQPLQSLLGTLLAFAATFLTDIRSNFGSWNLSGLSGLLAGLGLVATWHASPFSPQLSFERSSSPTLLLSFSSLATSLFATQLVSHLARGPNPATIPSLMILLQIAGWCSLLIGGFRSLVADAPLDRSRNSFLVVRGFLLTLLAASLYESRHPPDSLPPLGNLLPASVVWLFGEALYFLANLLLALPQPDSHSPANFPRLTWCTIISRLALLPFPLLPGFLLVVWGLTSLFSQQFHSNMTGAANFHPGFRASGLLVTLGLPLITISTLAEFLRRWITPESAPSSQVVVVEKSSTPSLWLSSLRIPLAILLVICGLWPAPLLHLARVLSPSFPSPLISPAVESPDPDDYRPAPQNFRPSGDQNLRKSRA